MGRLAQIVSTLALISAAYLLANQTVNAAPFTISETIALEAFGAPNLSEPAHVTLNGTGTTLRGGMLRLVLNDGGGIPIIFDTFSAEFETGLVLSAIYDEEAIDPADRDDVNALWANAFPLVDNAKRAAAFQFSLWEILLDTGLDLSSGALTALTFDTTAELAQSWLDNVQTDVWLPSKFLEVTMLTDDTNQDLLRAQDVVPEPIPLPPSAAMMLGLSATAVFTARRRRASQMRNLRA
ncbi:MAG: hypothetical protein ACKVGZ_19940 [Alphaproteobacteria bacterium]|jgi:hypothetical protein